MLKSPAPPYNAEKILRREGSLRSSFFIFHTPLGSIYSRPQVFARTSKDAPAAHPYSRILAVGAEALSMTPSGDALFAS